MKKVIFIASTGGHLAELLQLKDLFKKTEYMIITENTKSNLSLAKKHKRVEFLIYGTKKNFLVYPFKFIANTFKSLRIFLKFKPDFVIGTGAHTCVPMFYIAKLFGKKTIYIETMANIKTKTLTGRIVYPITDLFLVQWESMLKLYPKAKYGGWIY